MADAFGNMVGASDTPEGLGTVGSTSFDDMPKELLKLFTEVEKVVKRISDDWKSTSADIKKTSGLVGSQNVGSGKLGLGSFSPAQAATGLGLGVVAVGAAAMSMAPSTMAAVTQAMGASTYAGFAGMSNMQATRMANSQVGMGATSAMGPTMAAMTLSNMGYTANSMSSQNVMTQIAGLSAMTGMSNEQVAGAMGGVNGMNFLRLGIRVRDSQGNLLPPNQIVNSVYNALFRGQKISAQQAATAVLNPGGKGYQVLQQVAGGNQSLMQTLQSGIMARAQIGSDITSSQMGNAKTMLSAMNVDKSSPMYSNFNNNTAQAGALAATEQGLVGGYNTALNTNAALTNDFTSVANAAKGVTSALMGLKGLLDTFPGAGNVGGTLSGIGSLAASAGINAYATKRALKGVLGDSAGKAAEKGASKGILSRILGLFKNPVLDDVAVAALAVGGTYDHGSMGHTGVGGPVSQGHQNVTPVPRGTPVTSPYGQRGGGAKTKGFHAGLDFGAKLGTKVYAHDSGVVTIVGNGGGYGNYIEIDHGSYRTRYAHLKQISVSRGQKVSGGTVIGLSGNTGNSTGPHLHFEVLVNGKKVNPAPYLQGATSGTPGSKTTTPTGSGLSSQDINSLISSLASTPGDATALDNMFGQNAAHNLGDGRSLSFVKGKTSVTAGTILGTGSQQDWAKTLLTKLGKPTTKDNITALTTWAAWEGGQWHNSAHYNPLNTTQGEKGATNMNSEGVKSYTGWDQGYQATIQTLNNGRYKSILSALTAGNNTAAVLTAVDQSPWGTHIPGYGGPTGDLGTASIASRLPTGVGGPSVVTSSAHGGSVVVNLNMKVQIAQSSVAEAKRLVSMVGQELKNSAVLKSLGGAI
jgi:murein DD-endopeptidase MepM/ murein hydrolase activator NlpD